MAILKNKDPHLEELLKEAAKKYEVRAREIAKKLHDEERLEDLREEDYVNWLIDAYCVGYYENYCEGYNKRCIEIAAKCKQLGIDVGTISKATGLTPEEIATL